MGGCLSAAPSLRLPRGQRNRPRRWRGGGRDGGGGRAWGVGFLLPFRGPPNSQPAAVWGACQALPRPFPPPPGVNPPRLQPGVWGSARSREPREGSGADTAEREGVVPRDALPRGQARRCAPRSPGLQAGLPGPSRRSAREAQLRSGRRSMAGRTGGRIRRPALPSCAESAAARSPHPRRLGGAPARPLKGPRPISPASGGDEHCRRGVRRRQTESLPAKWALAEEPRAGHARRMGGQ